MDNSALRSATRKSFAFIAYRVLLNTAFLVALLHAFPDHQSVAILGYLAFVQGIAALGMSMQLTAAVQNARDDAAERKTRHTILLASDPDWQGDDQFWTEVDRRVSNENVANDASPWWAQIGLTTLSFFGFLVGDIATVFVALIIASVTQ
jgi:hypothetical protein